MSINQEQIQQAMDDNPDLPRELVVELLGAQERLEDAEDAITAYRRRNSKLFPWTI